MKLFSFCALVVCQTLGLLLTRLASKHGGYSFDPASAVAITELCKLLVSATLYKFEESTLEYPSRTIILKYLALALGYALNNQLTFALAATAEPALISLAKSSTPFFTAMMLKALFSRAINPLQWSCILLQALALLIINFDPCKGSTRLATGAYLLLTTSVFITASTSAINESMVKTVSLSVNAQNMVLYSFGAAINFITFLLFPQRPQAGFLEGYSLLACCIVFVNALTGVSVVFLYKYADAVVKCFAMSASSAVLLLLGWMYFGFEVQLSMLAGALVLFVTMFIYFVLIPVYAKTVVLD